MNCRGAVDPAMAYRPVNSGPDTRANRGPDDRGTGDVPGNLYAGESFVAREESSGNTFNGPDGSYDGGV